ncbi:MAG: Endonuclease III [candidate division TA06 bacterium ADurb.Bin417]|uniref:Endonuclease III n=1 Tax=candidate division TA06 bacterium ADurb.Bin417 TaxID=1852828 RepID=A0A1V5MI59_UNCT6|nr:MAG: Endonuclease III [candidate division TA06 bacterium ADurb.Bin417]
MTPEKNRVLDLYRGLRRRLGAPAGQWEFWCRRPKSPGERERVILESILTQRANWKNVQQAVENLSAAGSLGLAAVFEMEPERLARLVRPSGFYRQKAARLQALAGCLLNGCGGLDGAGRLETPELRRRLLALNGVGPETADDILLYAFERPVFVIDEYTRRRVRELGWARKFEYRHLQELFESSLPADYRLYQDFHALIVEDGKATSVRNPAPGKKGKSTCRKPRVRAKAG